MRLGVIADTHIPDRAKDLPQEILDAFKNVDMIIHAGDFVELTVLDKLRAVCSNVRAVYGNMDTEVIRKKIPEKEILTIGKYKIGLTHGCGPSHKLVELLSQIFKSDDLDIIIFGHSHNAFNEKIGKVLYFNPGSPTDKIFAKYNSYGIIEINDKIEAKIIKL